MEGKVIDQPIFSWNLKLLFRALCPLTTQRKWMLLINSAASWNFLFFSCSVTERRATMFLFPMTASVLITWTSNNSTVCGCHTPLMLSQGLRSKLAYKSLASRIMSSHSNFLYPRKVTSSRVLWCHSHRQLSWIMAPGLTFLMRPAVTPSQWWLSLVTL